MKTTLLLVAVAAAMLWIGHAHHTTGRMPWDRADADAVLAGIQELAPRVQRLRSGGQPEAAAEASRSFTAAREHLAGGRVADADRALTTARRAVERGETQLASAPAPSGATGGGAPRGGGGSLVADYMTGVDMQQTLNAQPAGPQIRGGRTKARDAAAAVERSRNGG